MYLCACRCFYYIISNDILGTATGGTDSSAGAVAGGVTAVIIAVIITLVIIY